MIGLEIVKDKKSNTPDTEKTKDLMEKIRDMGVLVAKGGILDNVILILPPLVITMEDAAFACDVLEQLLTVK